MSKNVKLYSNSDDKVLPSVIEKRDAQAIFFITSSKQMSNNYAPCFSRIDYAVIPFYIELPCTIKQSNKLFSYLTKRFKTYSLVGGIQLTSPKKARAPLGDCFSQTKENI